MMNGQLLQKQSIPQDLKKVKTNRFLPLFLLFNCGLSLVAIVLVGFNILLTLGSQQGSYAYVQTEGGKVISAAPVAPLHRSEEVIRAFVKRWEIAAFNWVPPGG